MKTITLISFFLCALIANAQIVDIPDPEFKNAILNHEPIIDTNFDGEIQVSEAIAYTGTLDVNGQFIDIYDLSGIEAFINITGLEVWQNKLTELDLSQNTKLKYLNCWNNPLQVLNITNCKPLEELFISKTLLTEIDLTIYSELKVLSIGDNTNLIHVDLRNGNNTNISNFTCLGTPNVKCIYVDDAEYSEGAEGWYKDPASTYVETRQECDALGVEELLLRGINIFPNPVKNTLNIELPTPCPGELHMEIMDITGKNITSPLLKSDFALDVSHLASGIYFLKIYADQNKPLTKKFVKL